MRRLVLALLLIAAAGPMRADAAKACHQAYQAYDAENWTVAARECRKAAAQGNAVAQFFLGVTYLQNVGVPKNYRKAAKWLRKAAEQGHAKAQYKLGYMYLAGRGVPKNSVLAYMWWRLAADQRYKRAVSDLSVLDIRMTPASIAKARELANKKQSEIEARKKKAQ